MDDLWHDTAVVDQKGHSGLKGERLTMLAVIAPLMLPKPIAIPRVTLRLYVPSTLFASQAMEFAIFHKKLV